MRKRSALLAPFAVALAPGLALAATPQNFRDLANQIVQLLSSATVDLIVLAIVVYFWGVSSSLFKQGSESRGQLRQQLLWGVFVLFLAVSIFGVVRLLQSSVFGSGIGGVGTGGGGSAQNCTSLNCQFGSQ